MQSPTTDIGVGLSGYGCVPLRTSQVSGTEVEFFLELLIARSDEDFTDTARAFLTDDVDELGGGVCVLIGVAVLAIAAGGLNGNLNDHTSRLVGSRRAAAIGNEDGGA